jgi:hypothetical protein
MALGATIISFVLTGCSWQFGSKQSSPLMNEGTLKVGRFDGSGSADELGTGSTNSSTGSPQMTQYIGQQMTTGYVAVGSPLRSYSPVSATSQSSTPKATAPPPLSTSPLSFSVGVTTTELTYSPQQMVPDRFMPWTGEAHAPTAILG